MQQDISSSMLSSIFFHCALVSFFAKDRPPKSLIFEILLFEANLWLEMHTPCPTLCPTSIKYQPAGGSFNCSCTDQQSVASCYIRNWQRHLSHFGRAMACVLIKYLICSPYLTNEVNAFGYNHVGNMYVTCKAWKTSQNGIHIFEGQCFYIFTLTLWESRCWW